MDPEVRNAIARIDVGGRRGTGFLAGPGLVLTAMHVVADRKTLDPYEGEVKLAFPGHATTATIVEGKLDAALDWALLRCADPPPCKPLSLGAIKGWDKAWESYGFPEMQPVDGMVTSGTVKARQAELGGIRAIQLYSEEAAAGRGGRVPGFSGGPIVVADGCAVGLLRFSLMSDGRTEGGTLYACPMTEIAAACDEVRLKRRWSFARLLAVLSALGVILGLVKTILDLFAPSGPTAEMVAQEIRDAIRTDPQGAVHRILLEAKERGELPEPLRRVAREVLSGARVLASHPVDAPVGAVSPAAYAAGSTVYWAGAKLDAHGVPVAALCRFGDLLVSGDEGGVLLVWDGAAEPKHKLKLPGAIRNIIATATAVVVSGDFPALRYVDPGSGEAGKSDDSRHDRVTACALTGKQSFFTSGPDGIVVERAEDGTLWRAEVVSFEGRDGVRALACAGAHAAAACGDGTVWTFGIDTGDKRQVGSVDAAPVGIAWSGSRIFVADESGNVFAFDRDGKLDGDSKLPVTRLGRRLRAFCATGDRRAALGADDAWLQIDLAALDVGEDWHAWLLGLCDRAARLERGNADVAAYCRALR